MHKSLAGSLLFFAFVSATYAGEIRIGEERPLTPIGLPGPAAFEQFLPSVASNGRDFFALWVDQRSNKYDVYGTRIDRDGVPRAPQGIRIAVGWPNMIASAGNDYLVASGARGGGATMQRLDENGTLLAPPRVIPGDYPQFLVSNGSTYLMVTGYPYAPAYRETAILLDRDGVPLRTLWSSTNICIAVGVHNGNYVIVDSTEIGQRRGMLHTITESGIVTHAQLPSIDRNSWLTAAFSGDRILIGWQQRKGDTEVGKGAGYLLVDYDGRLQTAVDLDDPPRPEFVPDPTAWWDGNEFGLVFSRDSRSIAVLRVSANGTPESSSFLLSSQTLASGEYPRFASADTVHMILWSGRDFSAAGDIVARTFPSFAAMGRSETKLISYSGQPQTNVRAARGGGHEIMVWIESHARLFAAVDGVTLPIAPRVPGHYVNVPSVAAGKGSFLVVWLEASYSDNFNADVSAVRIAFDGRVIDSIPIVLWHGQIGQSWESNAGIASDGTTFVITWAARNLFVARLPEDRSIHFATLSMFPVGAVDGGTWFKARSPQVALTEIGFFVGYSLDHLDYSDGRGSVAMAGMRIVADRDFPLPTFSLFDFVNYADLPLAMAVGAFRATFVWSVDAGLGMNVAQVRADGAPLRGPRKIRYTPFAFQPPFVTCTDSSPPAIAWNGAEFVVAWTEVAVCQGDSTVRAIRLDAVGDQLDPEPFDIAPGVLRGTPSIVPTAEGVDIIYSRNDADNGQAPRAFARSLARLPPLVLRQRAVR